MISQFLEAILEYPLNLTKSSFNSLLLEYPCSDSLCGPFRMNLSPGRYFFELWGSQGEDDIDSPTDEKGGRGGYTSGILRIREYKTIFIFLGNQKGFNGGGRGGNSSTIQDGGFGGGATDIRTFFQDDIYSIESLESRILVAGGGGGYGGKGCKHYWSQQGPNGLPGNPNLSININRIAIGSAGNGGLGLNGSSNGQAGLKGDEHSYSDFQRGHPGQDGRFGYGGYGGSIYGTSPGNDIYNPSSGGGGGGGYFGGGGGGGGSGYWGNEGGAGGGGSGYISPQFENGIILSGNNIMSIPDSKNSTIGHSGNGAARITYLFYDSQFSCNMPISMISTNNYMMIFLYCLLSPLLLFP